ncbi:hypothetical protein [Prevotella nigrescens]|uniref:hypothetical protein n=1 Tax=Prevotella nigrescens TaxID=28133 RepID=UPI0028DC3B51|nr:hypothetical protein [Prevotella nigrescens]
MNNAKDIITASVKGLAKNCINYVPIFGTMVDIYEEYAALQTQRKIERLKDFYRELNNEVQNLNEDYISQADFLDIFEKTARYVVNERLEKKRLLYKNILLHSVTTCSCSYDKTESYFRLLEQLSSLGIDIITILYDPIKYNKEKGMIIPDLPPIYSGSGLHYYLKYNFVEQLQLLLKNEDKDDVIEELYFLEANRIIYPGIKDRVIQTNNNPVNVLEKSLTKKGENFLSFLVH